MARKYRRLRYEDRQELERMSKEGMRIIDIAHALGVHQDTIYKEFLRCGVTRETYRADIAQRLL